MNEPRLMRTGSLVAVQIEEEDGEAVYSVAMDCASLIMDEGAMFDMAHTLHLRTAGNAQVLVMKWGEPLREYDYTPDGWEALS